METVALTQKRVLLTLTPFEAKCWQTPRKITAMQHGA